MSSIIEKVADLSVKDKETEAQQVEEDEKEDGLTDAEKAKRREANRKKKEKAKQKKKDAAAVSASADAPVAGTPAAAPAASSSHVDLSAGFDKHGMHHFFNDTTSTMLKYNKQKARHVVARKNIDAGETIFETSAYGSVPIDACTSVVCHRCYASHNEKTGEPLVLYKCSQCNFVRYCSTTCKNAHAQLHTIECPVLTKLTQLSVDGESAPLRLVIRILFLRYLESKSRTKLSTTSSSSSSSASTAASAASKAGLIYSDVASLVGHEEIFDAQARLTLKIILTKIQDLIESLEADLAKQNAKNNKSKEESEEKIWQGVDFALHILEQIQCNAHSIVDAQKQRLGLGLFVAASYLNHSCEPTCVYGFNGDKLVVRAIRNIKEGEEITYAYTDIYQPRKVRHDILKSVFYINNCFCEKCKREENITSDKFFKAFICHKCFGKGISHTSEAHDVLAALPLLKEEKDKVAKERVLTCATCTHKYSLTHGQAIQTRAQKLLDETNVHIYSIHNSLSASSEQKETELKELIDTLENELLTLSLPRLKALSHTQPEERKAHDDDDDILSPFPLLHPYHPIMFNAYLTLATLYRSLTGTISSSLAALTYASYVIECMEEAGGWVCQPELAQAYHSRGEAALHIVQAIKRDDSDKDTTTFYAPARLIPLNSSNAASLSVSAQFFHASLSTFPTTSSLSAYSQFYLQYAAYNFYRSSYIRRIAFGARHLVTKESNKQTLNIKDNFKGGVQASEKGEELADKHASAITYAHNHSSSSSSSSTSTSTSTSTSSASTSSSTTPAASTSSTDSQKEGEKKKKKKK